MEYFGVVKKIYLPKEVKNGEQVEDFFKTHIGFVVEVGGKLVKVEVKQNEDNCKIYKGDAVKITVNGKTVAIEVADDETK